MGVELTTTIAPRPNSVPAEKETMAMEALRIENELLRKRIASELTSTDDEAKGTTNSDIDEKCPATATTTATAATAGKAQLPSEDRRNEVEDTRKEFGILYETYRDEAFAFETVQMIFKVLLWVSLVMLEKGSQFQLAFASLICIVQIAVHVRWQPFSTLKKNILQFIGINVTALIAFGGLVLNYLGASLLNARLEGQAQNIC